MQLTGPEIKNRMIGTNPDIVISPFDDSCLGSNSYDLHLGNTLSIYKNTLPKGMNPVIEYTKGKRYSMRDWFNNPHDYENYCLRPEEYDIRNPKYLIDPCDKDSHAVINIKIPETGVILSPNIGYLGTTVEYTETRNLFPYIDGKSSIGRNFILNHHTAGRGDDGFCGHWTLEIRTLYPTIVYPFMRIGQIYYEEFIGDRKPYNTNKNHYNGQIEPTPAAPIQIDNFLQKTR